MKNSNRKPHKCMFINLAEQIALQNKVVEKTVDDIVERLSNEPGAAQRPDWNEIKRTAETSLLSNDSANTGVVEDIPKPKSIARNKSDQRKDNLV